MPSREVGRTEIQHFALLDERLERLENLLPRGRAVDMVHLVQIDVIGLHSLQARVAGKPNVLGGQAFFVGPVFEFAKAHVAIDFGSDNDALAAVAALREIPAQNLLGDTFPGFPSVHVGGVPKVDAQIKGVIHDFVRIFFGRLRAEVHGSQTQTRNLQAGSAQTGVLHIASLQCGNFCAG